VPLKEALSLRKTTRLKFLCEARFKDYRQHVVKDQQGLDLSQLKDWVKTVGPWLKVSLAVIFVSAKIAANVVLPGVGLVLPNVTQFEAVSSLSQAIVLGTGFSKEELDKLMMEGTELEGVSARQNPCAINGRSRKALSDFFGKLSSEEYDKRLGLKKVRLRYDGDSVGVVWICTECFRLYGSAVTELPI
jgi:hypothetical protein